MSCSKFRREGGQIKLTRGSSSIMILMMMMMMALPDWLHGAVITDGASHGFSDCVSQYNSVVQNSYSKKSFPEVRQPFNQDKNTDMTTVLFFGNIVFLFLNRKLRYIIGPRTGLLTYFRMSILQSRGYLKLIFILLKMKSPFLFLFLFLFLKQNSLKSDKVIILKCTSLLYT